MPEPPDRVGALGDDAPRRILAETVERRVTRRPRCHALGGLAWPKGPASCLGTTICCVWPMVLPQGTSEKSRTLESSIFFTFCQSHVVFSRLEGKSCKTSTDPLFEGTGVQIWTPPPPTPPRPRPTEAIRRWPHDRSPAIGAGRPVAGISRRQTIGPQEISERPCRLAASRPQMGGNDPADRARHRRFGLSGGGLGQ